MWFKSLHLYRVHDAVTLALPVLGEALQEQGFRPLGGVEAKRMGWIAPAGRGSEAFVHEVNGQRLLSAQRQECLLPASVSVRLG
ncbi:recombination-associated protein RdgC [Modicisalibacter luteus]|uniref:Recombination-associated protein RdgC n=1 Tax=Modicisalibacter luteus TaxID=453962 RepID=A0ABV7LX34_9GAMM|nr:recombination-associated protein RdgC [Halomonas lutea]GHB13828.1 hypothetical protein GCM10007159_40180 [Halomonas lutea]